MPPPIKPHINVLDILSITDWFVFVGLLLLTVASILYGQYLKKRNNKLFPKNKNDDFLDLLIMGRRLTLPMFVATLVATWYGGIFGVTRIAFEKGIFNFITQGFFWYLTYIFFALFMVHRIKNYQAITLPDLIGSMFGPKSMKLAAIFNFFNVVPIVYVISLGLFGQIIWGGPLWLNMILGVALVLLYSTYGGFRAVVFSDIVQFFIMCLAVFLVLCFSVYHFGNLQWLKSNLPPSHFSLTGGSGIWATLVWGFIALSTLVDPNFYQRCFAAKSPQVATKGILISTFIWFLFDICTTFGAMYARAVIPTADADKAYLIYGVQLMPSGLRGFLLAGILATILSTLDSYLIIASSTISYDLMWKKFKKNIVIHHLSTIIIGILAILLALYFHGNIKIVWKTLGSYSASCLLLPIMAGHLFPRKISDNQFIFSCFLGILGTTFWKITPKPLFWAQIDELYIGMLCTLCGLLIWSITKHFRKD